MFGPKQQQQQQQQQRQQQQEENTQSKEKIIKCVESKSYQQVDFLVGLLFFWWMVTVLLSVCIFLFATKTKPQVVECWGFQPHLANHATAKVEQTIYKTILP